MMVEKRWSLTKDLKYRNLSKEKKFGVVDNWPRGRG